MSYVPGTRSDGVFHASSHGLSRIGAARKFCEPGEWLLRLERIIVSSMKGEDTSMSTTNLAVEQLQRVLLPRRGEPADVRSLYLLEADINKERLEWDDRFSVSVPAGAEVSFQTYFNAFPASYWRRWSQLDSVVLKLEITGEARVDPYRSKIRKTQSGAYHHRQ